MVRSPDGAHYRMIAHRILAGRVVPFLGAGVNLCGRPNEVPWQRGRYLPSGAELATYLASGNDYPYDDPTDLLRVSQYVDVMLGNGPLYEELHDVFDADYAPTAVHRLLASIPSLIRAGPEPRFFPLNVTTNYDDLLERAFKDAGEEYDLVTVSSRRLYLIGVNAMSTNVNVLRASKRWFWQDSRRRTNSAKHANGCADLASCLPRLHYCSSPLSLGLSRRGPAARGRRAVVTRLSSKA